MKIFTSINWRTGKKAGLIACSLCAAMATHAQSLAISTMAGYAGKGSTDGVGGSALFFNPQGMTVDGASNVYVADSGNNTIRVITAAGVSSTLAGTPGVSGSTDTAGGSPLFNQPSGIALDSATNIYVTDYGNSTLREITPAGVVTTIALTPRESARSFFIPWALRWTAGTTFMWPITATILSVKSPRRPTW
jgi:hypothetical protein